MQTVSFSYRSTRMGATTKTYVIKDGKIVRPAFTRRSRTGCHGEDIYRKEDVDSADVILHVDVSNSGKHYCRLEVRRSNPQSIAKALKIHSCEALAEYL